MPAKRSTIPRDVLRAMKLAHPRSLVQRMARVRTLNTQCYELCVEAVHGNDLFDRRCAATEMQSCMYELAQLVDKIVDSAIARSKPKPKEGVV